MRRDWLCDLLAAKRPALGKNPSVLLADLYSRNARRIKDLFEWSGPLIEQMPEITWPHGDVEQSSTPAIANGYLFALIAKAIERPLHANEDKTVWRDESRIASSFAHWLRTLHALGYQPTPIEQAIIATTITDYTDEG